MNGLSLRVSTVKGNENLKKSSELRLEILEIPKILNGNTGKFSVLYLFGFLAGSVIFVESLRPERFEVVHLRFTL